MEIGSCQLGSPKYIAAKPRRLTALAGPHQANGTTRGHACQRHTSARYCMSRQRAQCERAQRERALRNSQGERPVVSASAQHRVTQSGRLALRARGEWRCQCHDVCPLWHAPSGDMTIHYLMSEEADGNRNHTTGRTCYCGWPL